MKLKASGQVEKLYKLKNIPDEVSLLVNGEPAPKHIKKGSYTFTFIESDSKITTSVEVNSAIDVSEIYQSLMN